MQMFLLSRLLVVPEGRTSLPNMAGRLEKQTNPVSQTSHATLQISESSEVPYSPPNKAAALYSGYKQKPVPSTSCCLGGHRISQNMHS